MRRLVLPVILAAKLCSAQQRSPDEDRDVSWKQVVPNIVEDQKSIWLFPRKLDKPRNLIPSAAFLVIGAALVVGSDPPVTHYLRNTTAFNGFNRSMPSVGTSAAILAAPIALYGTGLLRKDTKMTRTALLAGEAVADAEILTEVLKPAVSRWRPSALPPGGNFADTFAEGGNRFSWKAASMGSYSRLWCVGSDWIFATDARGTLHF